MSHKVELRNYLSAAGDERYNFDNDSVFRSIDEAKNKLDQVLWKARNLFQFFEETCEIEGLDVTRSTANTQVEDVQTLLTEAQSDVAALSWPNLDVAWGTDKAAVSDLTDYVEPAEEPIEAGPADPEPEPEPAE